MANLPNDPIDLIPEPQRSNGDIEPSAPFPELLRIERDDLVGPVAANRQHASLEKRTLVLRGVVNELIALVNQLDNKFLRKDNTEAKDGITGPVTNLSMNAKKLINMARGAVADGSAEGIVGAQLFEVIEQFNLTIASLTMDSTWSVRMANDGRLALMGDAAIPGPNAYYGTNASGVRGYWPLPAAQQGTPNHLLVLTTVGANAWTVPFGVTQVYVGARGATGGTGGDGDWNAGNVGGGGGFAVGLLMTTPGDVLPYTIGGRGGNGPRGSWQGAGGGGGGGTRFSTPLGQSVTGGGGGGGGGGGEWGGVNGGAGGGGGMPGQGVWNVPGGAAGSGGITTAGGAGGAGGIGGSYDNTSQPGASGGVAYTGNPNTAIDWAFDTAVYTPGYNGGQGYIVLRWYEP